MTQPRSELIPADNDSVFHLENKAGVLYLCAPDQKCYARMNLADLDYAAQRNEDFRAGYELALKDRPTNPWAPRQHLVLAVDDYGRLQQQRSALERFDRIQRDFPASPQARSAGWYRGVIFWWGGHWREAAAA